MRAVAYCRVSTDKEDQVNSLHNQIDYFSEFFDQEGHSNSECGVFYSKDKVFSPLRGIYADEGLTGTSLKRREAFKRMILDAKKGLYDIIYTKSVARFGRSVEDTAKVVKDLKELGIGVYFMDIKVNSLDNSKEFLINLFAALAQEESNNKSYIVQFGIRKAQKMGKWTTGNPPYGYDIENGYLIINETEVKIVKRIFDSYYNKGFGTSKIARQLTNEGILTKRGTKWSQITISRILENPIYIGKQIQHLKQTTDVNRQIKNVIPEEEWIVNQLDHLKIIEPELFNSVQDEKRKRLEYFGEIVTKEIKHFDDNDEMIVEYKRALKRGKGSFSGKHLLSNILYCNGCGTALKRKKRNTLPNRDIGYEWCCSLNDRYGKARCAYRNALPEEEFIKIITEKIIEKQHDTESLEVDLKAFIKAYFPAGDLNSSLVEYENQLVKTVRQKEMNFDLYSEGDITKEEYLERNKRLEENLQKLKSTINKIKNIDKELEIIKLKHERFINHLKSIDVDELTNVLLKRIISKVIVKQDENNKKHISVMWNVVDKSEEYIVDEILKG